MQSSFRLRGTRCFLALLCFRATAADPPPPASALMEEVLLWFSPADHQRHHQCSVSVSVPSMFRIQSLCMHVLVRDEQREVEVLHAGDEHLFFPCSCYLTAYTHSQLLQCSVSSIFWWIGIKCRCLAISRRLPEDFVETSAGAPMLYRRAGASVK